MTAAVAFIFPGQGSQRVGMLQSLPKLPELSRLLDAAEAASGLPLRVIAATGPDRALADTRAAQPLLYLSDWAWATALDIAGVRPSLVAGHSLGELAALAFAGVFSVEEGLDLVCTRGRIMADTASSVPGTMAAVLGMDRETVAGLVDGADGVWVANDNGPSQVVLSGTHAGIEWATEALSAAGARRVVPLEVAGPFHSPLMAPAAAAFSEILARAKFSDARIPVVQNTMPNATTLGETIRERLVEQIVSPVRWTETISALVGAGTRVLVETGPGSVLAGLARRVDGVTALSAESDGVDRVVEVVGA
jgi:[acyl-carrier-protein] S-malonyltransferase